MFKNQSILFRLMAYFGMTVTVVLLMLLIVVIIHQMRDDVPSNAIIELNLDQPILEKVPPDPVGRLLAGQGIEIKTIVDALEKAKNDDRVSGLLVHMGGNTMTMGQAEEIREAIESFKRSGKPVYGYSETFGQLTNATVSYYVATACDRIFMQPGGDFGVTGLRTERLFLGDFFEKYGFDPDFKQRYEYKNFPDALTGSEFTEYFREAELALMNSQYENLINGISDGRNLDLDEVRTIVDQGPWFGDKTFDLGLIDGLYYRDEIYLMMRDNLGDDAEFYYLENYYQETNSAWDRGKKVALIQGDGLIVGGESHYDPLMMQSIMGSETLSRAFRSAIDDEVEAIIFRVTSTGGTPWAAEAVRREMHRAIENDIPVIATMGDVAGSGGYYLAIGASKIVAHPSTITASIGVTGGKLVVRDFAEEFGLRFDHVETSPSSGFHDFTAPYNEHHRERLNDWLDYYYELFVEKVAEDRNMSFNEVHEIAKGRVWSGSNALELGLIDELGGYLTAINLARKEAGIDPDEDILLKRYPPEPGILDMIRGERPESSEKLAAARSWKAVQNQLAPIIEIARSAGFLEPVKLYEMPRFDFIR